MNKTISVVIPSFNSSATIKKAIDSILSQSCPVTEIIVVDDASTDNTIPLLKEIALSRKSSPEIIILSNELNRGPAASRNKGILRSSSEWIAFLDADDSWHPRKLQIQLREAEKHGMSFIGCLSTTSEEELASAEDRGFNVKYVTSRDLLWKNYFQTPTVLVRREVLESFDETMRFAEDFDLWQRIIRKTGKALLLQAPLVLLGKAPFMTKGLSSQLVEMERGEISVLWKEPNVLLRISSIIFSMGKFCVRFSKKTAFSLRS